MSSAYDVASTAAQALNAGIIAAIVVGSVVGFAILVAIIICIYCICCRKKKQTYPGAIIQQPNNPSAPAPYYNQATNKV